MRTSYFNKDNEEVVHYKKIQNNYIYSWNFVVDIVSALPIADFIGGSSAGALKLINLIKILRLLRLQRLLKLL